ncbi:DsbA family protein [Allostreptomyces psammosilenae]|uniref:Protein-disulfide isomerase n=1 Tax=Allostreptomyces psammosilenae TaxID=1892865 RepID=A0A852ZMW2_9ACTN|nr:thioredoxin domain-containing protein [Allostreptomyces psammosilenae]NYI03753.1 protein-disulfide isomerase [Allostreptomyces psammosilenae]
MSGNTNPKNHTNPKSHTSTGNHTGNHTGTGKRAARERLREQRETERRRETLRRRLTASAVGVVVVAIAATVAIVTANVGDDGPLVVPAGAKAGEDTVVLYGDPDAPATLEVYEDPRCPYCGLMEESLGGTIKELADQGRLNVEYHFATFIDDAVGGDGSKTALNALAAALETGGQEDFIALHQELYANQPAETDDAFADPEHLIDLAGQAGVDSAEFAEAVRNNTYGGWVERVSEAFADSGVTGTPTVRLDGEAVEVIGADGQAVTPEEFTQQVERILG